MMRQGAKVGFRLETCLSKFVKNTSNLTTDKKPIMRVMEKGETVFAAFKVVGLLYNKMADQANCPK